MSSKNIFRSYWISIMCIIIGLILYLIGIIWESVKLFESYSDLYGSNGDTTQLYEVILMYMTSFGTIFVVFGIALFIYYYRIRIVTIDLIYFVIIVCSFFISLVARMTAAGWYYTSWSLYEDGDIGTDELFERFNFMTTLNLISTIGLFIMFVIICLLIIELLRLKGMNLLIPPESQQRLSPHPDQIGQTENHITR